MYFDDDPSALLDNFPYLGEELSFANYKDKFANLLYLEEMEQTEQMTQFRLVKNWYFFRWSGFCLSHSSDLNHTRIVSKKDFQTSFSGQKHLFA